MYVRMHACLCVCMYVCIYVRIYVCMYVCINQSIVCQIINIIMCSRGVLKQYVPYASSINIQPATGDFSLCLYYAHVPISINVSIAAIYG